MSTGSTNRPLPRGRRGTGMVLAAIVTAAVLASCSFGAADTSVAVTGSDDECTIAENRLAAGKIDFEFTNRGSDVSELYVLRADGDVIGEVENVTSGTTRSLTADLAAGEYRIRCKPGQVGDGITTDFTVTGDGGTPQAAPDATVAFEAVEFTYRELDLAAITAGQTIRFEMTNRGTQSHEFEVLDPAGTAIGEAAEVAPGGTSSATITFESPGVYRYQCILKDPATGKTHSELGMEGTFEVPAP